MSRATKINQPGKGWLWIGSFQLQVRLEIGPGLRKYVRLRIEPHWLGRLER